MLKQIISLIKRGYISIYVVQDKDHETIEFASISESLVIKILKHDSEVLEKQFKINNPFKLEDYYHRI